MLCFNKYLEHTRVIFNHRHHDNRIELLKCVCVREKEGRGRAGI